MANPIVAGGVGSPQSIYDEYIVTNATNGNKSRQEGYHPVGTRGYLPDGRVFYYASNGAAALTAGSLLQIPATTGTQATATDDKVTLTASFANFAVGAQRGIVLDETDADTADFIENTYKDGYLSVEDGTGEGYIYKIAAHDEFDVALTRTSQTIDLFDPIKVALAATTKITFCRNEYDRVIASTTVEELAAIGVAPTAVTASTAKATDLATADATADTSFFWAQTWGRAVLAPVSTNCVAGAAFNPGTTAKQVIASVDNSSLMTMTGFCVQQVVAAQGDFMQVELRIKP